MMAAICKGVKGDVSVSGVFDQPQITAEPVADGCSAGWPGAPPPTLGVCRVPRRQRESTPPPTGQVGLIGMAVELESERLVCIRATQVIDQDAPHFQR